MSSWWPLIKLVPKETKLTYAKFAGVAAFFSIALVIASLVSVVTAGFTESPVAQYEETQGNPFQRAGHVISNGFNLGVDFKGGTSLEVSAPAAIDIGALRDALADFDDVGEVQVQAFGDARHALIRFEGSENADTNQAHINEVMQRIAAAAPGVELDRQEAVSGKVSDELFDAGLWALGLAIVLMLIYIWFRFEWQFGLGAILGLFHDVILTMGLFSVFRLEFTLTIIAAFLTIIGYGINDTVVVFDRIRENLRKYKKMPLSEVIDLSLNQTLSRTIMTGCTALMALVALLYFGGEALSGFAIAMIFGIIVGTYSSLYVAAPALLLWGVRSKESDGPVKSDADLAAERP